MFLFEEEIPIIKIKGKRIGRYKGDDKAFREAFRKYYKKHLTKKWEVNPVLGRVYFFNSSIDETESKNLPTIENLKYIVAIRKLLRTSKAVTDEPLKHHKKDILKAWRIKGTVMYNWEKPRLIEIVVLEDKQHKRYYTFDARKTKSKSKRTLP